MVAVTMHVLLQLLMLASLLFAVLCCHHPSIDDLLIPSLLSWLLSPLPALFPMLTTSTIFCCLLAPLANC